MNDPRIEAALEAAWSHTTQHESGMSFVEYEAKSPDAAGEFRKAIVAALAAADAAAWRPIETAPQDTTILTYYADGRVMPDRFPYRGMLEWQEQFDAPPTHWQPLPAPPTTPEPTP